LKNILKSAVVMSESDFLQWSDLGGEGDHGDEAISVPSLHPIPSQMSLTEQLDEAEKRILRQAMIKCGSTRELAKFLRTSQSTIVRKIRKYGLFSDE
jgi:TyrR family helix-turn-helix protein